MRIILIQFITIFIIGFLLLNSCNSKKSSSNVSNKNTLENKTESKKTELNEQVEDFDIFYERFHSDTTFQVSRLRFPLKGTNWLGEDWTPDNWNIMQTKIFDVDTTKFKVSYNKTENEFSQKVWIEDSGFMLDCRFELIDKKWYLVYTLEYDN